VYLDLIVQATFHALAIVKIPFLESLLITLKKHVMASKHFLKVVRMVLEMRSMNVPISCFHLFFVSLSYMVIGLLCVTPPS
jgi:hypothetical protein